MSKKINLRGLTEIIDPTYRYKMSQVSVIKQKTKSIISNIGEVSKNVERDPQMLVEYLKTRLGLALKFDKVLDKIEIKSIEQSEVQNAIFEFIEWFVLCPTPCRNPETLLSKTKHDLIITCKACGHSNRVKDVNKAVSKTIEKLVKLL